MGLFPGNELVANETADNRGNRSQGNRLLQRWGKGPGRCQDCVARVKAQGVAGGLVAGRDRWW